MATYASVSALKISNSAYIIVTGSQDNTLMYEVPSGRYAEVRLWRLNNGSVFVVYNNTTLATMSTTPTIVEATTKWPSGTQFRVTTSNFFGYAWISVVEFANQ